jgi:hypothetical protein
LIKSTVNKKEKRFLKPPKCKSRTILLNYESSKCGGLRNFLVCSGDYFLFAGGVDRRKPVWEEVLSRIRQVEGKPI